MSKRVPRIARVDRNQAEIAFALRMAGASVAMIHMVGGGVPDLLAGVDGENYLLEVKTPDSNCKLTPGEELWHAGWNGQVAVVSSVDEALRAVGLRVMKGK